MLHGELNGRTGVCGVPVRFGPRGWHLDVREDLDPAEDLQIEDSFNAIQIFLEECSVGV
jgi:hypothetical protein